MADATRIQIPAELARKMDDAIARYPRERRRSAVMPLLHLWQEHFGFVGDESIFCSSSAGTEMVIESGISEPNSPQ